MEQDTSKKPEWYHVDQNVRLGDFDKAIRIAEELIRKTSQYPDAHRRLAGAYLAAGNIKNAREHYAEAFRLFPSEENEKLLIAVTECLVNHDWGNRTLNTIPKLLFKTADIDHVRLWRDTAFYRDS